MSSNTWNQIYELVGRMQYRALQSHDWQAAKDADQITTLLHKLTKEVSGRESVCGASTQTAKVAEGEARDR